MLYKKFIEDIKPDLDKAIKFLENELSKLRTSRASPSLVEDIEVNAFGSKFTLKQLGAISVPQANQILIQPWDTSYIEPIEKAVSQANLGFGVVVDKNMIRINLPTLTEEYRLSLTRMVNERAEQVRQTIRDLRDKAWKKIQEAEKAKEISEDDKYRGKDELQKVIDEYNEKVKRLVEKKKEEINI